MKGNTAGRWSEVHTSALSEMVLDPSARPHTMGYPHLDKKRHYRLSATGKEYTLSQNSHICVEEIRKKRATHTTQSWHTF